MKPLKLAAGALALLDSVLGIYLALTSSFSGVNGGLATLLFWGSVVLLLDSLLCIYGVHYAFPAAAVLAAVLAADSPLVLASTMTQELALTGLSLVVLVANVLAFRSKSVLSEQANPMNLPVFG